MITRELLRQATAELTTAGCDSPRLDAECLLAHAWSNNRAGLIARATDEVPEAITRDFFALIERRVRREPLAYLTGEKEFWSRSFSVDPSVLIPRPETEHLIEACLATFPDRQIPLAICDIGTGSGCIAVTLACEYPDARVVATDISAAALETAQANATRHGVADRITFRLGSLLDALQQGDGPFELIVSNPPYVAAGEMEGLAPELAFEPRTALTDESDGLQLLREILERGLKHLKPDGRIIVETGSCGLPEAPAGLLEESRIRDLAGHLRAGVYRHL
ncbi:MAG TPA: peptide chain release factor N(5)-glutamine methyltransferase [Mariprofundaceae bacterium]|nr:peptide chain release factor N(5)-glutamine methyltransferase [Mariprofundaceae bacterium]